MVKGVSPKRHPVSFAGGTARCRYRGARIRRAGREKGRFGDAAGLLSLTAGPRDRTIAVVAGSAKRSAASRSATIRSRSAPGAR
jgi:hypothetical protein